MDLHGKAHQGRGVTAVDGLYLRVNGAGEVERDLAKLGVRLADLDFTRIANEGMRLAASFAPRKSGKLAQSIKANKSKSRATIRAGSSRVPYAGAINYGWRKRGIEPAHFMQRADLVLRRTVPAELENQIRTIIARQGFR